MHGEHVSQQESKL